MRIRDVSAAVVALSLPLAVFAGLPTYVVPWEKLESALKRYIAHPDMRTAKAVGDLLPPAMEVSHRDGDVPEGAVYRVWDLYGQLSDRVIAGEPDALDVAWAVYEVSDAGFAETIAMDIDSSIDHRPREFLRACRRQEARGRCYGTSFNFDVLTDDAAVAALMERRIRALEAIHDRRLREFRDEAIRALTERLQAYRTQPKDG